MKMPSFEELKKQIGLEPGAPLDLPGAEKLYQEARKYQMADPEGASERLNYISRVIVELRSADAQGHEGESPERASEVPEVEAPLTDAATGDAGADLSDVLGGTSPAEPVELAESMTREENDPAEPASEAEEPAESEPGIESPLEEPAESEAAAAPKATTKTRRKKKTEPNWGSFLGRLGGASRTIGHGLGKHGGMFTSLGGALQTAGHITSFAQKLAASGGEEAGEGVESVLPAGGEGDREGLGDAVADMTAGGKDDNATESRQQTEGRGEVDQSIKDLIDAVKKLTEEMQKQHGKPGGGGDHMPEGGSFGLGGGSGAAGGIGGMIGEALGLSPGEIQLILTMFRMLSMAP